MPTRDLSSRILPAAVVSLLLFQPLAGCEQPPPPSPVPPPLVEVKPATRTDGARELRLSGSLSAERSIVLSFATIGTVKEVKVQEGQAVKRGQILATLEPRSFQDALGIAKAKADQAEDAYRRLLPMYQNQTVPEVKMVEVETGRAQARLAVSMARKNLEDTQLRAPVSGTVASRNVEPGAGASPGLPAFTLVQTKTLMATAPVPEMQMAKVRRGVSARVTVPALDKSYEGVVGEIDVIANPLTRTYDIKVALSNPDGELRVGMIADVHLRVEEGDGGLVVPPEAVRVDESGAHYVFVVGGNKRLEQRPVEVAQFIDEGTALAEGIREGELVVTSGTPMLADGMAVRVLYPSQALPEPETEIIP